MSLPSGFLDELRSRLSLSQVVGRKVMWDNRKSNQAKGDMWAPCPFHQEKTASFHVDDRQGFYYCFGCHAKGDAITFVRETENVDFMEAVRILASEAGLQMPERDPQAQQKADHRTEMAGVMEQALRHYRMMLKSGAGAATRDYLAGRGLSTQAIDRWEIGFAPDGWQGLLDHLTGQGVAEKMLFDCGLAKPSQKGGRAYDTFRNRIMFPIRDARGRCIAFGGRAMDPNDNAKYLNSPETDLFDKGRSLFNHGPARTAAGKGAPLIVAEGYMDVIALAEAGFEGAVAPLGTAITETQLQMLWRIAPEPIVALDGDTAGVRAAYRVIDLALPLLEAGQSLRFALMPDGMDPDDLIRAKGAGAVQKLLDAAQPMVQLLWRRETEGRVWDSPERRAALDKALRDRIKTIRDASIRQHYGQAVKDLRWVLFRGGRKQNQPWKRPIANAPQPDTRTSALASGAASDETLREAVILAILVANPVVLPEFAGALEEMDCTTPGHNALRHALLVETGAGDDLRDAVQAHLPPGALDDLFAQSHVAIVPAIRHPQPEMARQSVAGEIARLTAQRGHERELAEAMEDFADGGDEHLVRRLGLSAQAMEQASRGQQEDRTEYEIGPNGAHISREEQNALDRLLQGINYSRGKKHHN